MTVSLHHMFLASRDVSLPPCRCARDHETVGQYTDVFFSPYDGFVIPQGMSERQDKNRVRDNETEDVMLHFPEDVLTITGCIIASASRVDKKAAPRR